MAYQHPENRGSVFKNKYKTADKHPDFKGQVNVKGIVYDIALWKTDRFDGMSLTVSEPYNAQPSNENQSTETNSSVEEHDPDDPF
tara:strand:+ start:260 stop:514 length:255 start_codon:yes stop_codon:yes gene_type:complete